MLTSFPRAAGPRPPRASTGRGPVRQYRSLLTLLVAGVLALLGPRAAAQDGYPDEATLQEILGRPALRFPGEQVLHFYWWRHEVPVEWQGRPVEVFEGDSLRLSVKLVEGECLASGRWLVFADEAIPVVSALTGGGLRVTSVIPRFPGAHPQPFDVRFIGRGSEAELAGPVARARDMITQIRAGGAPPASLPTSEADGPSDVDAAPIEELLGCKAEVKNGVVLFRMPGPPELAGQPAGTRMGVAVFAAFAGQDERARARLDWTMRQDEVSAILDELGSKGFVLESLTAAAPGFDDGLSQVSLVARGQAIELARTLQAELGRTALAGPPAASFVPPSGPELLGVAEGKLSPAWHPDATLPAGPERARWTVQSEDDLAPHLNMEDPGNADSKTFNLLWSEVPSLQDGSITLRMRADRGRIDQGGGPIWRVQDANNYYVCRFNPLEQDFRVYHVKDGNRVQIQAIGGLPFRSGDWFTIQVQHVADRITCTLNDSVVLRARDDTFPMAGGVGIWSKADSQPSVAGFWAESAVTSTTSEEGD